MTKSHQQAYIIEFCSHGIAIRKFCRDPFNSWGDGIGVKSPLLRKILKKFYIIWLFETQLSRIFGINAKGKSIAGCAGLYSS
jgi:hypothetical protein